MASTYSSLLRIELQNTGENDGTWGDIVNTQFQLFERSIHGAVSITATGNVTLSTADGAEDQARYARVNLSGTPGAPFNLVVPNLAHTYQIINGTDSTCTVKTSSGTITALIPAGETSIVWCDGSNNVYFYVSGTLVETNVRQATATTGSGTITLDYSAADRYVVTATGNITLALSNMPSGKAAALLVEAVNFGDYTITHPSGWRFDSGIAPTYTSSGTDIVALEQNANGTVTLLVLAQGVATV